MHSPGNDTCHGQGGQKSLAPFQSDSIKAAVNSLMGFVQARDSSIVYFTGLGNVVTPVWINSRSGMMHRYWLKTDLKDSVTVWIGAQDRNTIGLYLENGISFSRPVKQGYNSAARIEVKEVRGGVCPVHGGIQP